jgi:hypothetical protein
MRPRRYRAQQIIGLVVFTSLLGASVTFWLVGLADAAGLPGSVLDCLAEGGAGAAALGGVALCEAFLDPPQS